MILLSKISLLLFKIILLVSIELVFATSIDTWYDMNPVISGNKRIITYESKNLLKILGIFVFKNKAPSPLR